VVWLLGVGGCDCLMLRMILFCSSIQVACGINTPHMIVELRAGENQVDLRGGLTYFIIDCFL
jgi:hypothetical protein